MTGFAFAHGSVGDMTSPTRMPVHLMSLKTPATPARPVSASDRALRSAVVNVANYYLRMAQHKTPAEMEAIIWGSDSVDGVDHGESCAAFASLTLALGAQATGQESWVTGGTSYPWPLHQWADVRVDPNPASPGIISVLQDAQAHQRWHPLGDGYQPQPGDWVLFDGHVEVVTRYSAGVLYTIGGDSSPNLSVNAHTFTGPLAAQGVTGFVNNGELLSAVSRVPSAGVPSVGVPSVGCRQPAAGGAAAGGNATAAETAGIQAQGQPDAVTASAGEAAVPGTQTAVLTSSTSQMASAGRTARRGTATGPGTARGRGTAAKKGTARMVGTAGGTGSAGMQSTVAMPGVMAGAGMTVAGGGDGPRALAPRAGQRRAEPRRGRGNPARAGSATRAGTAGRARQCGAGRYGVQGRTGPRAGKGQRTGTAAIPGLQATTDVALAVVRRRRRRRHTPGTTRRPQRRTSRTPPVSRPSSARSRLAPWRRKAGTASRRR